MCVCASLGELWLGSNAMIVGKQGLSQLNICVWCWVNDETTEAVTAPQTPKQQCFVPDEATFISGCSILVQWGQGNQKVTVWGSLLVTGFSITTQTIWWFIDLDFLDSPDFMLNTMCRLTQILIILLDKSTGWISRLILVKAWWVNDKQDSEW